MVFAQFQNYIVHYFAKEVDNSVIQGVNHDIFGLLVEFAKFFFIKRI